ncbi:MAG: ATP-binding cassette domain-containing protein [Saccharospirillum sp.]|nr:ATP-binding cassette domain-containing protein [Saccharospirillum sp.]
MLEVKNVKSRWADQPFHWHFQVKPGDLLAIVGTSGVGKSTLLNVLCGLHKPDSGDVQWQGDSVMALPAHRRPFGMLFQSHNLFDHLSVEVNLALGLNPSGRLTEAQRQALLQAAERFGIAGLLTRKPYALSGGQQQRVALARVFLQRKPVLLLDEPFSSLDPALRQEGLDWVKDIQTSLGTTVLLVTHHLDEMVSVTDQVLLGLNGDRWLDLSVTEFEARRQSGELTVSGLSS